MPDVLLAGVKDTMPDWLLLAGVTKDTMPDVVVTGRSN